jgi:hypothetical protein
VEWFAELRELCPLNQLPHTSQQRLLPIRERPWPDMPPMPPNAANGIAVVFRQNVHDLPPILRAAYD